MAGIGSMVKANISAMRHRIDIDEQVSTIDSSRQLVHTFTNKYADQPAEFKQVAGGEYVRGRQIEAGITAIFRINYRENLLTTDRVVFDGQNYGIIRIDYPDGIKRFADLYCKAVL